MGSRSLGRLFLRPDSFARSPVCESCSITRTVPSWTVRRCISNTPKQNAVQPQRKEEVIESEPARPTQPPSTSTEDASLAIDSLFPGRPPQRQPGLRPQNSFSSGEEVQAARANRIFGSEFAKPSRTRPGRGPPRLNFDEMNLPDSMLDPNLSNKPSEAASLATQQEEQFKNYPRLNPTYGRMVELDPSRGRDLVRGIGMLGSLIARNKVKYDVATQKFHERPGLKRKRLHSVRWRARFKRGFTQVTARVTELTRKGW